MPSTSPPSDYAAVADQSGPVPTVAGDVALLTKSLTSVPTISARVSSLSKAAQEDLIDDEYRRLAELYSAFLDLVRDLLTDFKYHSSDFHVQVSEEVLTCTLEQFSSVTEFCSTLRSYVRAVIVQVHAALMKQRRRLWWQLVRRIRWLPSWLSSLLFVASCVVLGWFVGGAFDPTFTAVGETVTLSSSSSSWGKGMGAAVGGAAALGVMYHGIPAVFLMRDWRGIHENMREVHRALRGLRDALVGMRCAVMEDRALHVDRLRTKADALLKKVEDGESLCIGQVDKDCDV